MKKLVVGLSVLMASIAVISCGNKGGAGQYPGYDEVSKGLYFKTITDNVNGRVVKVGANGDLNL